ncbi:hypothetical protein AB833_20925 [Chromatiales bacterium (ex Bugula neritina AB1)]|nr:hypothetical protein AB833_20925 [Chromatiales bacterium (ex Bugula neritina AB1)]
MNESQAIDCFSALAHSVRLSIFRQLISSGCSGVSAGAIGEAVGAAPSKVSFHVAALERAGLASSQRVSRQIIYRINIEKLAELFGYLMTDCCKNDPDLLSCCGIALDDQSKAPPGNNDA